MSDLQQSKCQLVALAGLLLWSFGAQAEHYTVPLLVPAGTTSEPQGVLRILNATDEPGAVEIYAIDDAGTRSGPATFTLNASAAVQFTAADLASGNATLGLAGGIGTNVGDARLQIETDLQIVPLAFVQAADGTLSAMHDTVRGGPADESGGYTYDVPVFNPSTEMTQVSRLRLINPGDAAAAVTIAGRDDSGAEAIMGDVTLVLAAGGAKTLTAQQLEAGDTDLTGQLGAGTGKWRLTVSSDQPLEVVNIVASTAGYRNNLSTTAVAGAAPGNQAGFNERFVGNSIIYETSDARSTIEAADGNLFTDTVEANGVTETYMGSYSYRVIGPDAGLLTLDYDDGDRCRANLYFSSRTSGWFASHCTGSDYPAEGSWLGGTWLVEADDGTGEVDRFPSFRTAAAPGNQTYTVGTAIATLTLPEATGGNGALTYSLAPSVPGLTFNATTRQLSGTPSTAGTHAMTYTVTDEDGDTDTLGFTITVNADTTQTGSLGECYVSLMVGIGQSCTYPGTTDAFSVNARGRGSFLTFLAGIRIRIDNETINGQDYDFEASHQGDGVWRIDRIAGSTEVPDTPPMTGGGTMEPEDTSPSFAAGAGPGNQTYTVGTAIATLTLPEASGGDGTLTYSLSPSVPGLTFNATARQLSGTPSAAGTHAMTYTVTDENGDSDTLSFTVTVEEPDGGGNDRAALMALYNATDGANWSKSDNWGTDAPLDQWYGVTVDSDGRVSWLNLTDNQLSGPIPAQLGNLANLLALRLNENQLSGPIPAQLGNLTNLVTLFLYENRLSGPIPAQLGNLANLVSLWLSRNQLSGPIPAELGNLANLESLFLEENRLSGPIPAQLGNIANLETLWLFGNQLSGPIPAQLGNPANLRSLFLRGNQLSGCIPDGLRDVRINDLSRLGLAFCGDVTMDGETSYGLGDEIATLPTGSWTPDMTSDGSFSLSGGDVVVRLDNGGYIEVGDYRFRCQSAGGCEIRNRQVVSGTIIQSSTTAMAEDTQPSFTTSSGPGNQSYEVGTAIDTLTLPEATGGNGNLTYSLSPSVPGLTFNATARQLTGTPSAAGTYAMTYTVTDEDGDTDTLSFSITVVEADDVGDPTGTSYGVNDALPGVPTGFFVPAVVSGGGVVISGGGTTITLRNGGHIQLDDGTRYTCTSADGCTIENGTVTQGTVVGGTEGGSASLAPADMQSFNSLVVGNRFHGAGFYIDFPSAGRFLEDSRLAGSYSYANTGSNTATLAQTYDDTAQYGGSCTHQLSFDTETTGTSSYTCASGIQGQGSWTMTASDVPPAPRVLSDGVTDTSITFRFSDSFDAGETKAYDFQVRRKTPRGSWNSACSTSTNNSANTGRGVVEFTATDLQSGTVYEARYRSRNSSTCDSGSPDPWSLIGEGSTTGAAQGLGFTESEPVRRSIPENLPGGINVGPPVSAVGGDALAYSIGGVDADSFAIVPETGQIRTVDNVSYDYESKDRYLVEVAVADEAGNRESVDVVIDLLDLGPSCNSQNGLNLRTNSSDSRLTVRWNVLAEVTGRARVLGYQTEIRRGGTGPWTDQRTFLGQAITGAIYANLDNEIEYQIRVRAVSAEGDCEWSAPVSGIPTGDLAPRNDVEHVERFGPHPIGTDERNFRLLTPGRCRHTLDGVNLDANCSYVRTSPTTGRITLEFDDPSRGSCDVALAYSSLTAGSFIDECFDAGVNTNVPFDRSFRMPRRAPRTEDGLEPPPTETVPQRAPRNQEEFDALVHELGDFIPGLCFGICYPGSSGPPSSGVATLIMHGGRTYTFSDYTYESTGPSQGIVKVTDRFTQEVWSFALDVEPSGNIRVTITPPDGGASVWPGIEHLDLTLGAQSVLLPIPPSWSAAIAIESDSAPADIDGLHELAQGTCADDTQPAMCVLLGNIWERAFIGPEGEISPAIVHDHSYRRVGPNRGTVTVTWTVSHGINRRDLTQLQYELLGTTWVYDLTFTADGAASYVRTITKDGYLPHVQEGFADFTGDGIDLDTFPDELLVPEAPPQAAGEDLAGIEVAAATSTRTISTGDVQTFVVSNTLATYRPGDWLEPKDGNNQRMMIVGAAQASAVSMAGFGGIGSSGSTAAPGPILPAQSDSLTTLFVVCMQRNAPRIPLRGDRYFSRPKSPETAVELCQRECVLAGGDTIQGCVWRCESTAAGSTSVPQASSDFGAKRATQLELTPGDFLNSGRAPNPL